MLAKTYLNDIHIFQRYYSLLSVVWTFLQLMTRRKEAEECHQYPQSPWKDTVASPAHSEDSPAASSKCQTLLNQELAALCLHADLLLVWQTTPLCPALPPKMEKGCTQDVKLGYQPQKQGWRGSLLDTGLVRDAWTMALPKLLCLVCSGQSSLTVDSPQLGSTPKPTIISLSQREGSDKERWCRKG